VPGFGPESRHPRHRARESARRGDAHPRPRVRPVTGSSKRSKRSARISTW
jgi:hypothetical protein